MRISMWGPRSSGKTTYIAMVYGTALKSNVNWIVKPNDLESTKFVRDNINLIRNGGFPPATMPVAEPNFYHYQIYARSSNRAKDNGNEKEFMESVVDFVRGVSLESPAKKIPEDIIISLADVAGEQFLTESLDHPLWEHLAASEGLICLLDPADAQDHFDITFQLLQFLWLKLKERPNGLIDGGMLPHYVAFCFSKVDQPEFAKFVNKPRDLVLFLESQINLDIDKLLLQYFLPDRIKYFTISSVGLQAKVDGHLIENPRQILPINVLEPLQWLFLANHK